jgi:urease accessory protein
MAEGAPSEVVPPVIGQPTPLRAHLALLRLASPGLPVGAFSYSRGLEPAVAAGWVHDEASAGDFILGVLERSICPLEGAILLRLHDAWSADDAGSVRAWTLWLRAARESRELLLEDEQMGLALRRLLINAGVATTVEAGALPPSFTCMFALAAVRWGIAAEHALAGYFWVYCEAQTTAVMRLLPLGQTAGQRLLERALPIIEACTERARTLPDDEIGNFAAGLALASAHHESQYSRLFRS